MGKTLCRITTPQIVFDHSIFDHYIGISQGDIVYAVLSPHYHSQHRIVRIDPVLTAKPWSRPHVFVMMSDLEEISDDSRDNLQPRDTED
jgi:hypothetical protein